MFLKKALMSGWITSFDFVKDVDDTIDKLQDNKNLRYTLAKPTSLAKVFSGENVLLQYGTYQIITGWYSSVQKVILSEEDTKCLKKKLLP